MESKSNTLPSAESTPSPAEDHLRLADFIHANTEQIVDEWENFASQLSISDDSKSPLALRDHIYQILAFIVHDMKMPQTNRQQIEKSQGEKEKDPHPSAAETHAAQRLASGFNIDQMVSEYRALRASVIKLWTISNTDIKQIDILDLTRFNESIDQELAESVSYYTRKVSYSKDLFVGILSHELRNPLNVISMSAQLMLKMGTFNERQSMLTSQINESTIRIGKIVDELLDLTRARFGSGLPITRTPMNLEFLGRQIVDEMRTTNPTRTISLDLKGDLKGEWDKTRIGQIFTNLIGNAVQYSFKNTPIAVTITGMETEITLSVHNDGKPIPPEKIKTIFDSLTRAITDAGDHPETMNLGLGLYITKEIIVSHGGTIEVTSTEEKGTTFIATLPRFAEANR